MGIGQLIFLILILTAIADVCDSLSHSYSSPLYLLSLSNSFFNSCMQVISLVLSQTSHCVEERCWYRWRGWELSIQFVTTWRGLISCRCRGLISCRCRCSGWIASAGGWGRRRVYAQETKNGHGFSWPIVPILWRTTVKACLSKRIYQCSKRSPCCTTLEKATLSLFMTSSFPSDIFPGQGPTLAIEKFGGQLFRFGQWKNIIANLRVIARCCVTKGRGRKINVVVVVVVVVVVAAAVVVVVIIFGPIVAQACWRENALDQFGFR